MTAKAAARVPPDPSEKKSALHRKKTGKKPGATLAALSEYSLSDFLETEPDLYSVSDLKVRYR